uniref:phosphatidate phosphatase PAH2-like n=1 Tax=Erigeron canadensis TaxID=72917 RepID=UPI001CB9C5F3|nr:phosphatidate phosphatase PAH2-like [Erigeron canadensis]
MKKTCRAIGFGYEVRVCVNLKNIFKEGKMYAVGRLSSYITRGVSTVSGPFHPFGGAIDIVVVQQQDGSLKSSPWYVRFGKFQGVLKVKERVVDINVNGVEADFHMYLNPKGEAYFLREDVDSESKSMDFNFGKCNSLMDANNGKSFSRTLGFALDRKNTYVDESSSNEDGKSNDGRKSAEIAADLLEKRWSTNCCNGTSNKHHGECKNDEGEVVSGKLGASLVLHEEHFVHKAKEDEKNSQVVADVDKITVANVDNDGNVEIYEKYVGCVENSILKEENLNVGSEKPEDHLNIVQENVTEVSCIPREKVLDETQKGNYMRDAEEVNSSLKSNGQLQDDSPLKKEAPKVLVEEQFTFGDLDDRNPRVNLRSTSPDHGSDSFTYTFDHESIADDMEGVKGNIKKFPSESDIAKGYKLIEEQDVARTKSLPNIWSHFDDSSYYTVDPKRRFSRWDMLRKDASRIIIEGGKQPPHLQSANFKSKNAISGDASKNGDDSGKSWSLWPFNKSRNKKSQKEHSCKKDSDIDTGSELDLEKDPLSKSIKLKKELTPTPEQLESLNLTEGKNTVTFKFSTAVLGDQQVDARIFLWRWDTHIVISDVDGTITKSDVLGQFMPLVGKDWSHIGVTHLFSAIKENGYEILFLSARSISQADMTRQFLISLKQEGKTLPEGPVVISPDGLFPSLFREVIQRAPHEFKIACLADIRACFPADWNPFYAGFGNRDTDEFSYLKVGIPKGKIFIINPKGEVVVNRCNDTKSYSSLHTVVDGIFPPKSMHKEANTPKKEADTPKKEADTPKKEAETPKKEAETPKREADISKKEDNEPKKEADTPKKETNMLKREADVPNKEADTSEREADTH